MKMKAATAVLFAAGALALRAFVPGVSAQAPAALGVLHAFAAGSNQDYSEGEQPNAALVQGSDGNFYGTTQGGGSGGNGTVFKITPTGTLSVLHRFGAVDGNDANSDGANPGAALIQGSDGNFYGTTYYGGTAGSGTVFRITPTGALTNLYSFSAYDSHYANGTGANPGGGLILSGDGDFYGTTTEGGIGGSGTVFKITPTGMLTSLYSFSALDSSGANSDGALPQNPLIQGRDGNFYGVLYQGGTEGDGTVFRITSTGALTTLSTFGGATGGPANQARLLEGKDGNFYGTTEQGGSNGTGTIFRVTPAGTLTTLYDFSVTDSHGINTDGNGPNGGLIQAEDGDLYGTTEGGGTHGAGTVFKITPAGTLTSLYSFSYTDGCLPYAALIQGSDGDFYGTTHFFGASDGVVVDSEGTVFGLTTVVPAITSPATATAAAGEPFTYQITAGHFPASFGASGLPAGLSVDAATGVISGTSSLTGVYAVTLQATNAVGTGSASLALTITAAPVITSPVSATAVVGQPFTYRITAYNSPASFHASNLPAGLGVDTATGLISGTPMVGGVYAVTLQATNAHGTGSARLGLTVVAVPAITSALAADAHVGVFFSDQITATNTPTSYDALRLPAGLVVDGNTGLISGTPTTAGVYSVALSASNLAGTDSATLTLTVTQLPPVITSATAAAGTEGMAFAYRIIATNTPTGYGASGLPAGLSVNANTGVISGTPATPGVYTVTLSASNGAGKGSATLVLTVALAPPVITSSTVASDPVGTPFTYRITATNTPTGYDALALPAGLSVNGSTGVISGTPTTVGTYPLTLRASNGAGTGSATLILTVLQIPPVITSATTAAGTVGTPFSYQIDATGNPSAYGAAGLPAGLHVNGNTGVISGTPTTVGQYPLTLRAYNSAGPGSAILTLTVAAGRPVITSAATVSGTVDAPFFYRITATNDPTSYGATGLPEGLVLDADAGVIGGAPEAAGTYPLVLTAINGSGTGSMACILTILAAPVPTVTVAAIGDGLAVEGGEKGRVAVYRTGDTSAPLTVRYKVKGSAKPGVDYKPVSGRVIIPAGAAQAKVKIKAIDNEIVDGPRVAKVKLLPAVDGSYTLGDVTTAKIKIIDNDNPEGAYGNSAVSAVSKTRYPLFQVR